ncbi:MAG: TonB-dependent receptor, partial [Pseudomonadota bacterium]
MKSELFKQLTACASALAIATTAAPVIAQDTETDDVITVTGSLIKRKSQFDLPSPTTTVGSEDIQAIGAKDIADITQTLTFSNGAENRPDAFTQNQTVGTSSINLRGLGLNSTLILLNGRRQVLTGASNDAGVQFVDTSSLVPLIAIDRVEIVKDGASATYGSDAVAGVVNFITIEDYEGVRLTADYQQTTEDSDVNEYKVEALFGAQGDRSSVIAAISYLQREPLFTSDRRLSQPANDTSTLGNPGSYIVLPGGPLAGAGVPPGTPIIDPTGCSSVGGGELALGAPIPGVGTPGLCTFDFGEYFNLIADETRVTGYFDANYDLTDEVVASLEFGYARNRADRGNSPSFPSLTSPVVPDSNPFNVFGEDIIFLGRINGNGADPNEDRQPTFTESDTWRMSTALRSDTFGRNGYWEVSFTHAVNDFLVSTPDTVTDRLNLALNGFGGPDCGVGSIDLINGSATPGAGGCEFYNPFATSILDPNSANSDELMGWLLARQERNFKSDLSVFDATVSSELFDMPGGAAAGALGFQYREQSLIGTFDEITRADGFSFLFGDQNYQGDQDSYAVFGEVSLPFGIVELNAALRYEDYGGIIGDSIDPKVAIVVRPSDALSFRASYTTAFRAPSVNQQVSSGTSLGQVVDPS